MENTENTDPIDGQITNEDSSVTNKDGDNILEQGGSSNDSVKSTDIPTVTPDNDAEGSSAEQPPVVKGEQSAVEKGENTAEASNKGQGPKGENL